MATQKPAGYSGKALCAKLGIEKGMRVAALGAPRGYTSLLAPLPPGVVVADRPGASADVTHCFVKWRRDLERRIGPLERSLRDDAVLWVSWPKKSSGEPTDLTENILREVILPLGLVDVKVCAVDATWSGLKFVRRLVNRRPPSLE